MKRTTLSLLLLVSVSSLAAMGQINCASGATASSKLVCEFPFATGVLTNASALGVSSSGSSGALTAQQVAASINISIASQVSQLPIASASAGTVVVYRGGVPETFNNLGPILTDRAQTVGRHKLFIGFTASQFVFTDIDGSSLGNLPFAWAAPAYVSGSNTPITTTYTTESTNLKFKIDQFISVATFGITNRVDISAIIPVEYVSLGATTYNSQSYVVNSSGSCVFPASSCPYLNPQSHTDGTASGLGDLNFNVKASAWTGEHATVAAAFNFRAPTGDDLNYLGSGAWGFNPYVVYSYLWKVSPHAKVGYQWNTATELNNPTQTAGGNLDLPGGAQYDVGADWAAARHLTLAADLLGNQFVNTPKVVPTKTSITVSGQSVQLTTSVPANTSYTINNLSAGLKINPIGQLVLSGNVLVQLNNTGLRSRPTPLIGLSYKF